MDACAVFRTCPWGSTRLKQKACPPLSALLLSPHPRLLDSMKTRCCDISFHIEIKNVVKNNSHWAWWQNITCLRYCTDYYFCWTQLLQPNISPFVKTKLFNSIRIYCVAWDNILWNGIHDITCLTWAQEFRTFMNLFLFKIRTEICFSYLRNVCVKLITQSQSQTRLNWQCGLLGCSTDILHCC